MLTLPMMPLFVHTTSHCPMQALCHYRVAQCHALCFPHSEPPHQECLQAARYKCIMWRQTGGCSADGAREPGRDQPCRALIDSRSSGYCECGGGRVIRKPGCTHGEPWRVSIELEGEVGGGWWMLVLYVKRHQPASVFVIQ